MLQVDGLYNSCCPGNAGVSINLSDDGGKYIDGLIKEIFDNKAVPNDPTLLRAYGTKLGAAVVEGYGSPLSDLTWNSPDYQTLAALQNNVWQFSAAKSDTQQRDMLKALIGPDGKIRDFKSFKIEAEQIAHTQLNWLKAEYQTAVAGAQMAAKWVNIQAQKDTFPLLEFDAVLDSHSSKICPPLNKVTLPVDDVFWTIYFPPNHFNCRSTVRQLRKGTVTPEKDIQYPESMSKLFKGNVGIDGGIFSDEHPYYEGTAPHVINNATLYMPADEQQLIQYEAADGTQVAANRKTLIEDKPDLADLQKVAEVLADAGKAVEILPEIHAAETELRAELLPGATEGKNPDLLVTPAKGAADYVEIKKPSDPITREKIQQLVAKAVKQADRVIVLLDEEFSEDMMKLAADERFKTFPDLLEIGFVTVDGEYIEFLNDHGRKK